MFRSSESTGRLCLLGEQWPQPRLREVLERWQIDGPVALISAGWEEDEQEDAWILDHLPNQVVNAQLYTLAEQVFAEDKEVLQLLRQRQDTLRLLREFHLLQCEHQGTVLRSLWDHRHRPHCDALFAHAAQQGRDADTLYLEQVSSIMKQFDERIAPTSRPSLLRYRQRILERLEPCQAILIAGGHVGVLLNRLKLSRLLQHLQLPTIAWSGGAMALGERIYFYHQSIPHASRDVELSRYGLRWIQGLQVFPRAEKRLNLADAREMSLLAHRIPSRCLAMNNASELEWDGPQLLHAQNLHQVTLEGCLAPWIP